MILDAYFDKTKVFLTLHACKPNIGDSKSNIRNLKEWNNRDTLTDKTSANDSVKLNHDSERFAKLFHCKESN